MSFSELSANQTIRILSNQSQGVLTFTFIGLFHERFFFRIRWSGTYLSCSSTAGITYGTRFVRARFSIARENLRDAAVRHLKLSREVILPLIRIPFPHLSTDRARSNTFGCHFDDLTTNLVRQRTTVDEHSSQLIDTAMAGYERRLDDVDREHRDHTEESFLFGLLIHNCATYKDEDEDLGLYLERC